MSRARSTNRSEALKLWIKSGRTMQPKEIGEQLGVSAAMVRQWKFIDKWDEIPVKRSRGGQPGNNNSAGNAGGGAPPGNTNTLKHGYYAKYLPEELLEIVKEVEDSDPLELMWNNIVLLQAKLLHGQRIMHVRDKEDKTKEIKRSKLYSNDKTDSEETEWEIQFAWDKFAAASKADVLMMREFRSAVKQFLAAAPENDERRLKLEMMQAQTDKIRHDINKFKQPEAGKSALDSDLERMTDDEIASGIRELLEEVGDLKLKLD